jgi:hypothetical protein
MSETKTKADTPPPEAPPQAHAIPSVVRGDGTTPTPTAAVPEAPDTAPPETDVSEFELAPAPQDEAPPKNEAPPKPAEDELDDDYRPKGEPKVEQPPKDEPKFGGFFEPKDEAPPKDGKAKPEPTTGKLTPQQAKDFAFHREQLRSSMRQAAFSIREIVTRRLHREEADSIEEWCDRHCCRSGRWAYQMMDWLGRVELLEAAGIQDIAYLGLAASQELASLDNYPREFARAVRRANDTFERVKADLKGKGKAKKKLEKMGYVPFVRIEVAAQHRYLAKLKDQADLTYEEFQALESLGDHRRRAALTEARLLATKDISLGDALVQAVRERIDNLPPTDEEILEACRGDELVSVCKRLHNIFANKARNAEIAEAVRQQTGENKKLNKQVEDANQRDLEADPPEDEVAFKAKKNRGKKDEVKGTRILVTLEVSGYITVPPRSNIQTVLSNLTDNVWTAKVRAPKIIDGKKKEYSMSRPDVEVIAAEPKKDE